MAIEPPSAALLHHLQSLNLATDAQLRACQKHLRHLVRDLPAFDSVWIDALIQDGVLTPFQGTLLTESPASLRIGEYLLVDRLPGDGWPSRYQARSLTQKSHVALACLPVEESELPLVRDRFQRHLTAVQGLTHRHLNLATSLEEREGALWAASPLPQGEPFDELFVRRGRFPADVVAEIARQLLDALSRLEQAGTLHGDLRMRNLLLGPGARLQVINAGLVSSAHPLMTIHSELPVECLFGMAPELIGGRSERTPATEMYAAGCLLWQLLAGRPPHLTADRLQQMAAHQSSNIPDVRTMAPETPSPLAALIGRLVARHSSERFRNLTAAAAECGTSQARGRALLGHFQSSAQLMVPIRLGEAKRFRKRVSLQGAMTAGVLLGATALFMAPEFGRSLLESAGRMLHATQDGGSTTEVPTASADDKSPRTTDAPVSTPGAVQPAIRLAMRETQAHSGEIVLDEPGTYAPGIFSSVDELRVSGKPGGRTVIEVSDQPLRLSGQRVILENVMIRRGLQASPDVPLMEIDAQQVILNHCDFASGPLTGAPGASDPPLGGLASLRWRHLDEKGVQPGIIEVTDCLFVGGGAVLECDSVPQIVRVAGTACLGTGPLCHIRQTPSARTLRLALIESTLRQTGPVVREHRLTSQRQTPIEIDLQRSVLDMRPGEAVVEGLGTITASWRPKVRIDSSESYLSERAEYMGRRSEDEIDLIPIDPATLEIDGLLPAQFHFAGSLSTRWEQNIVTRYTSDVQGDGIPGISRRPAATTPDETPTVHQPPNSKRRRPTLP